VAQLAAAELARVKIFAAHMRHCAAKLQLGVNFLADTPNLDRVVEMSALTDALKAAFAEVQQPRDYPWPALQQQQQQWDSQQEMASAVLSAEVGADIQEQQRPCSTARFKVADGNLSCDALRPRTAPAGGRQHVTAAAAAQAGCIDAGTASRHHALHDVSGSSKASWRAKSPVTFSIDAVLPDPTMLLQQLQQQLRLSSSKGQQQQQQQQQRPASGCLSSRQAAVNSITQCTPAGAGHQRSRPIHRPCNAAVSSAASSAHSHMWGTSGDCLISCPQVAAMQRSSTAPAPQGQSSSWGSNMRGQAGGCIAEEICLSSGRQVIAGVDSSFLPVQAATAVRASAAASSACALRRKPSSELPARHAVQASAAAVKMAAVLASTDVRRE
jgi:hypothetical protein